MNTVLLPSPELAKVPARSMRGRFRACRQGCAGMKRQIRQISLGIKQRSVNEQVRKEIQRFLLALHSYPDCFVKNPGISFEQHHSGLMRRARRESQRV
jgi:hypothetical protein